MSEVNEPLVEMRNTVPKNLFTPPKDVVPYSIPAEDWTSAHLGAAPLLELKEKREVKAPSSVQRKTVPNPPFVPPADVVPYNAPSWAINSAATGVAPFVPLK